ncbi:ATP-binding protein [Streptacidiphilus melanogenes]|uniref:ATP-binding protein n=1 Tax=Streptacidiphilus melanogenes TaxID=411235 RepID=UPI0006932AFA|nr:ATP-binding protein [Streptacidiphilus melanogenes]
MPAHQIEFLFTRRPRLVAVARHRVATRVLAWGQPMDEDLRGTLELLVSELVTNAVLHATGAMVAVQIRLEDQRLRVEVEDDSPNPPPWPADGDLATWDAEHGRGLQLVTTLASRHGCRPSPRGKRVWFELAMPRPTPVRARAVLLRRVARKVRRTVPWPIPVRPLAAHAA